MDRETVNDWIKSDPDPQTRAELQGLLDAGMGSELDARFSGVLTFGTAGIRGKVGAGPSCMNRAVVIRTTAGLASHILESPGGGGAPLIVVGFDARPTSRQFAEDTAGVLAAAGIDVKYFAEVAPTPLVAFAAKYLGAAGAVVITASHNPPADNGYKVYGGNAAQIISPIDTEIAAKIGSAGPAIEVARVTDAFTDASERVTPLGSEVVDAYWTQIAENRPCPEESDLDVVYTPLHGVGGELVDDFFARAGHRGLSVVPEQMMPDGTFPTVDFPNPEEEGALDMALQLAQSSASDLIIANDPDADRLAAAVPHEGQWRRLTGNEIGSLLGDYVLRHYRGDQRAIVVNSIVSSPMLGSVAEQYGARHEVTLTGFKWIVNAGLALESSGEGSFVFGYEEALGFTVGKTVRDKDGISAALVFTDLVAGLAAHGETVLDRLVEIWRKTGLWASAQHSIVRNGVAPGVFTGVVDRLAKNPPRSIGDYLVQAVVDYREGAEARPLWLGEQALVELSLGAAGRVLVRPSGTEPKLKIYVDLNSNCGNEPHTQHDALRTEAEMHAESMEALLAF